MKRQFIASALILSLLSASASPAYAADLPSAAAPKTPATLTLTPEIVRETLLKSSLALDQQLQNVYNAKDQMAIARGNVLPQINLGGMLNFASGPSFILSSVQFLLPFLLPSNWSNLKQSRELLEAEIAAFKIAQLNVYSSALTLYYTALADGQSQKIYQEQAGDLRRIYRIMERESEVLGTVSPEDLAQAKAQADMSDLRASKLAGLIVKETAAIRQALGLIPATKIEFQPVALSSSDFESASIEDAVKQAMDVAPENVQLQHLVNAAKAGSWSKAFSWINSASLGTQSTGGENASFGNLKGSGSVNLNFGIFPSVKLSNRKIHDVELRMDHLLQETRRVMEESILGIALAKDQWQLAAGAEEGMRQVYLTKLKKYELGFETLTNVLIARAQTAESAVARIQSERDVNLLRIALHRAMLTDEFSKIRGCVLPDPQKLGFWKKIGLIFGAGRSHKKLELACAADNGS